MGKFQNPRGPRPPSDTHAPKNFFDKKAEEDNKNIFTNGHIMVFENNHHWYLFIFEPDTKSIERKHTLSAQHRLIITDRTFCNGVGGGPQDYRHSFAIL